MYDNAGNIRPGTFNENSIQGVANTGTNVFGGVQLKKIVDTFGSGSVLELGTNTGLSGCYFLSSKNTAKLITIEGSAELCDIAKSNLTVFGKNFIVVNDLFDLAIAQLGKDSVRFRYSFVDGQHEKKATILYKDLLLPLMEPGGVMIFDDIYWSEGMYEAWLEISSDPNFDMCLDLGWRGVCRIRGHTQSPSAELIRFDISQYLGKPPIQRPGW